MSVPLCPVCCDYFDRDNNGACTSCGANFRITLEVRRETPARVPVGTAVPASGGTPSERAMAGGVVGASDPPRCPRCGGEVDPAAWACYPCGWLGFDKYSAA